MKPSCYGVDGSGPPPHDPAVGFNDTCWVDGCDRQSNSSTKLCGRHLQQLRNVGGFFCRLVIRDKKKLLRPPTARRLTAVERIRELIAQGRVQSQADAVRTLGVSRQNISQLPRKHGIQLARAVRPRRARPVAGHPIAVVFVG
jgi:hypothetical protein